jgi:uncharacterized protein
MRLHILSALLTLLLFAVPADADETTSPTTVIVTTASPGGAYYVYGKGLATLLTKYVGITFSDQATQGPVQNLLLLDQRQNVLALTTMGVALQAWNGTDWTKGKQYRAMRAAFPMYDTPFQFAAPKRLNLLSLAAFAGKRIGAGPKAGTGGVYFPQIFKALDIAAVLRNGAFEDLLQQMSSGELDGVALATGVPVTELAALDAMEPLDYLQPTVDQVAIIRSHIPELTPSLIPAGTYPSLTEDYHTVGLYNFAVVDKDLPDDLVYKIVKAVFEHRQELESFHPAAKETLPANVDRDTFLPFHPGAVRYYREVGVDIPATLARSDR